MACRAILFIDGNNWFHSLKEIGLTRLGCLDYRKLSLKLVRPRQWIATRYHIGRVPQSGDTKLYADQRQFLAKLDADSLISTHLGRLEPRSVNNAAAQELRTYLASLNTKIDRGVYQKLMEIAKRHKKSTVFIAFLRIVG